jgi:alcohol dehydrogenase class IV
MRRFPSRILSIFTQVRAASTKTMTESTYSPLGGLWRPNLPLQRLHYGPNTVEQHLKSCLPSETSKAFIITGNSLYTKTPLIKKVEELLGSAHHAGTFSKIGAHAPVKQLDEATEAVQKDRNIDTIISIGGGSPIDSAKAISYRVREKTGKGFLHHISIPTTLSAAECTFIAGYTTEDGTKTAVMDPNLSPNVVIYDPVFAAETPQQLWLSTGLRAMDHAIELLYNKTASEMPCRLMALQAIKGLFTYLPKSKADPKDQDTITYLMLNAYASLGFIGTNIAGGLGLSHTMGYALGSPYGIPHGVTSCLTLGHVVKLKAQNPEDAKQIARALPFIGEKASGDDKKDAERVGERILKLVEDLGLKTNLTDLGVGKDQVGIVAERATRTKSGKLFDDVSKIVESLY